MSFYVYLLRCADGTLYTGYTDDPVRRTKVHNAGKGAKYTRARLPVELVYRRRCRTGLRPCGGRPPSNGWIAGGSWP